MRSQIQIGGYEIEFDRNATAVCYARIQIPGPESCGCAECRNWIAAREHVLSSKLRHLLTQLGIPTNGEIEVSECPGQSRPHLYGGWYFIVGRIMSGERGHMFDMDDFQLSFASGQSYAVSEFEGQEVCELHFHIEVGEYLSEADYALLPNPEKKSP